MMSKHCIIIRATIRLASLERDTIMLETYFPIQCKNSDTKMAALLFFDQLINRLKASTSAKQRKNYQQKRRTTKNRVQKPTEQHPHQQASRYGKTNLRYHVKPTQKFSVVFSILILRHNPPRPLTAVFVNVYVTCFSRPSLFIIHPINKKSRESLQILIVGFSIWLRQNGAATRILLCHVAKKVRGNAL